MRNIAEYPITEEEIVDVLKRNLPLEYDPRKHGIGSLDVMISHKIVNFIKRPDIMEQLVGEKVGN